MHIWQYLRHAWHGYRLTRQPQSRFPAQIHRTDRWASDNIVVVETPTAPPSCVPATVPRRREVVKQLEEQKRKDSSRAHLFELKSRCGLANRPIRLFPFPLLRSYTDFPCLLIKVRHRRLARHHCHDFTFRQCVATVRAGNFSALRVVRGEDLAKGCIVRF